MEATVNVTLSILTLAGEMSEYLILERRDLPTFLENIKKNIGIQFSEYGMITIFPAGSIIKATVHVD